MSITQRLDEKTISGWILVIDLKESLMPMNVITIPERCVGCKLCQLICSYVTLRVFNPARSHLTIKADEKRGLFDIILLPECTGCGACIKYCPGEALIAGASHFEEDKSDGKTAQD